MKYFIFLIFTLLISVNSLSQSIDKLNIMYNNAKYYDVINAGEEFMKDNPENPEILFITGLSYQMLNKFQIAERYLKEAYTLDSLNVRYINAYAYITNKNNYHKIAFSLYNRVLDIDSLNFTALNNLSKLLFLTDQYKDALKIYEILSRQDSLNSYYYRKTAYCYIKLKKARKGIEYYEKAYKTDSINILNIKALASVLLKVSKYDEAIKVCNKGILTDSAYSDFYRLKADALYKKNHLYRAVPEYKKVLQLGDSSYNISKRLGTTLCDTKKYEDALNYNLAVYNADSSSYSNTFYLSRTYLGLKQYNKCIEYCEKTLKLLRFAKRITFNVADNMAIAYSGKKDYSEALKMYEKKYNVFEYRYLDDYYQIALLNDKLGNKKTALKFYEKYVGKKRKHEIDKKHDKEYQYAEQRITRILEDLHFEGN